jgi:hypothetical protein
LQGILPTCFMKKFFTRSSYCLLLLVLISALIAGCKKNGADTDNDENKPGGKPSTPDTTKTDPSGFKPKKYPAGTASGQATQKTIGAEGGNIILPDGLLTLKIPAGAVTAATNFSIQPVTNTLPEGVGRGKSYRLLPEGVNFKKPVELTFKYDASLLEGTVPEALYLAYQDNKGYWAIIPRSTLNKTNRTLTVSTTHFSDWAVYCDFSIVPVNYIVKQGKSFPLKITTCESADPLYAEDGTRLQLGTIREYNDDDNLYVKWLTKYGGSVDIKNGAKTTYYAPTTVDEDTLNTEVHVTLRGVVNKNDPSRIGIDGDVTLISYIKVVGTGAYLKYVMGGDSVICDQMSVSIDPLGRNIQIGGTNTTTRQGITLSVNASKPGSYKYGRYDMANTATAGAFFNNDSYSYSHPECDPPYKTVYSPGSLVITKVGTVGDAVEGNFDATLFNGSGCKVISKKISGSFRIKRNS